MSAIRFVNETPASGEFHLDQGHNQIARIGVHAGGSAPPPIIIDENNDSEVTTSQIWTAYAIVNGITTANVTITNPNATVILREGNNEGFSLRCRDL
jgi:hypothetical protein